MSDTALRAELERLKWRAAAEQFPSTALPRLIAALEAAVRGFGNIDRMHNEWAQREYDEGLPSWGSEAEYVANAMRHASRQALAAITQALTAGGDGD